MAYVSPASKQDGKTKAAAVGPDSSFRLPTPRYNDQVILGLYGDNGKENGNYYLGFRVILGLLSG